MNAIDILVGIGWLDPEAVERWRRGHVECLEEVVRTNVPRISEALRLFRSSSAARIARKPDGICRTYGLLVEPKALANAQ